MIRPHVSTVCAGGGLEDATDSCAAQRVLKCSGGHCRCCRHYFFVFVFFVVLLLLRLLRRLPLLLLLLLLLLLFAPLRLVLNESWPSAESLAQPN